jgi:DNA-binding GntR family transcriptional regulator
VTSRTARINAARRAAERQAPPDLAALEARVRELDAAIAAEDDAIAYHEAKQERLGDDLHEAVLRLAAASDATEEGRYVAYRRAAATLEHAYVLDEKPLDFDYPARWRNWDEHEREAWYETLTRAGEAPSPAAD